MAPYWTGSRNPMNPVEGQMTYEQDYSENGTGFAKNSGPQSMAYFDYRTIPAYWDYAEEYGLGENYFSAVLSMTTPNRLMLLAGDTPVSANYGPSPFLPYNDSLLHQLDMAGVTWGYFDNVTAFGSPSNVYPLNYLAGQPQSAASSIKDLAALSQEIETDTGLPAVAFVNFIGEPGLSEHPPEDPATGETAVVSLVNQVMRSGYWNSTAIFVTWDEGGGFYDHVVPPREYKVDHGFSSPLLGFGQRVPLLVISPYAIENHVSNTLLSHLSLLRFIEYNWGISPLNQLVANANLPLDFFNFSQRPREPIVLSGNSAFSPSSYPIPLQAIAPRGGTVASPQWSVLVGWGGSALVVVSVSYYVWRKVTRRG